MKASLLWTLVAIQVSVIVLTIATLWVAIDYLAADYFTILMERYQVSPTETHNMFLQAVHRYLLSASLLAAILAAGLSLALTRLALRPLAEMGRITRNIAAGDFGARVSASSVLEIAALAHSFNRMADNLNRTEQMRRRLIGDAAHELRTPLCNIRGYLEAMRDGVVAPDSERLQMLHEEAMHLVRLTDSLFELARADAARLDLRMSDVDLGALIREQIELQGPMIEARGLSVATHVDTAAGRLSADPDRLRQVLSNLMHNAVRYAGADGWIRVDCSAQPDGVRVELSNNGPGIQPQDLSLVFERFYRGDKARSRSREGAGVGLAVVKELVEAHGGSVGIASCGGLTRVWFRLPYQSDASSNP